MVIPRRNLGRRKRQPAPPSIPSGGMLVMVLALIALVVLAVQQAALGPIALRMASHLSGHHLQAQSTSLNLFTFRPHFKADGLTIHQTTKSSPPLATIGHVNLKTSIPDWFRGKPFLTSLQLVQPSITIVTGQKTPSAFPLSKKSGTALHLPPIGNLSISNGQLTYIDDPHNIRLTATINAEEGQGASGFELLGNGTLNAQPFRLTLTGNSLITVEPNNPYAFTFAMNAVNTALTAQGVIRQPFNFATAEARVNVRGQDLADLYPITGLVFPTTKPYKISLKLSQQQREIHLNNILGIVGGSDLTGNLTVTAGGQRPRLTGQLSSKQLDVADVGILFGPPPPGKIFPTKPFNTQRLTSMDAAVTYGADSLNVTVVPLREVSLTIALDDGVLDVNPLTVTLPQGRVRGNFTLNAGTTPPQLELDLKLTGAKLEDLLTKRATPVSNAEPLQGSLIARARLTGNGNSVHDALSTANGNVTVVIPRGEIRQAFAELMGINVLNGLGLLLTDDPRPTGVRCGVAGFEAVNGQLTALNVVLDTDVVLATGEGAVNLREETIALKLMGHPKQPRIGRLMAPVTVTGTLRKPKVGVELTGAATQAGTAIALGALLTPLASLLPFVDPGLADDANCRALIQQARQKGVAVTASSTTPANQ